MSIRGMMKQVRVLQLLGYTSPDIRSAWSLRRVLPSYTGPLIRVRRSSDNAVTDIGALNEDLDTVALENFCAGTDGFINTLYDQGDVGDMIQEDQALQPQIVSNGNVLTTFQGTMPSMDAFAGNMQTTFGNVVPAGSAPKTLTVVMEPLSSGQASGNGVWGSGYNGGNFAIGVGNTEIRARYFGENRGVGFLDNSSDGLSHVYTVAWGSGSSFTDRHYLDGAFMNDIRLAGSTSPTINTANIPARVGWDESTGNGVGLSEFLVYATDVSEQQILSDQQNQMNYWRK